MRLCLELSPVSQVPEFDKTAWLIVDRRSETDIGHIRVVRDEDYEKEIGFVLLPAFRGQGVMSSVLPDFVKKLNENLYAETSDENEAAIKLLIKSGFVPTRAKHEFHTIHGQIGQNVRTVAFRLEKTI